jgi:hypothetical protein
MFGCPKDFGRIAVRYDKRVTSFASAIALVAVVICWVD